MGMPQQGLTQNCATPEGQQDREVEGYAEGELKLGCA